MRKTVAIVSQDQDLGHMVKALDEIDEHYDQKKSFLIKQAEALKEERKARSEPIMNGIRNHLRDKGRLPKDFDESKHHLHIDSEEDSVLVCDGEDHNGHPFFRMLAGMGISPEDIG
jgi:hypothetical protein